MSFFLYNFHVAQTATDRQTVQNGSTRPGLSVRSLQPLPRVGVHLPNRSPSPSMSSAPGVSIVRLQGLGSQVASRSEGKQSSRQTDTGARGGLQDQIQTLNSEVRGLGLAVKMLVEQQCRLEREQAQQTQIQKQILSTLQSFASKLGTNQTTTHPEVPPTSISEGFNFSEAIYTQCSQTQPSYNSLESLETIEDFKVPELNPSGFPPCSSGENVPLSHTSSHSQSYTAAYSEPSNQTLVPPYAPSFVSTQTHQTYRGGEVKSTNFTSSCSARALQNCSVPIQTQDPQISVIKEEGP